MSRKPNILLIAVDSLRADHMSCYGYGRLTTPHIDHFAASGTLFENTISAHIPTTSAYASMLTGRDCFGTEVVALRHRGPMTERVRTLPEILREHGYSSTCVGFPGNPASRGFDEYVDFESWIAGNDGFARKAENLNDVTLPLLERLAKAEQPWFVMLRHMDPHSPYLPPAPFNRMFYGGDERDPSHTSMRPVWDFKPFADYFATWLPGVTDAAFVCSSYDGALAYMDSCIATIFERLEALGLAEDTIVVLNGDHGETLYDHDCYFDHHGLYDVTLRVPLIIRWPGHLPSGRRLSGYNQHPDLVPTLLDLAGLTVEDRFDGSSLLNLVEGRAESFSPEIYITECAWMRKHGWRTPEWKLIVALEPDFHGKPPVELYNLATDPREYRNLADELPDVVAHLRGRMEAHIARREAEEGHINPMLTQGDWHGIAGVGAFTSTEQAYAMLHLGDPAAGRRLQATTTAANGDGA